MRYHTRMRSPRGLSLVDVLVGTALVLVIFLALFGLLRVTIQLSSAAKTKASANAIATSQMEYIRSLSYDAIGTIGGIPPGVVAETETKTQNGIDYVVRTFVQYVDDPADGEGAQDENGIITDYKRIKVEVSYTFGGQARSIELVTNQAPVGIETTAGGGTLRIDIVNAIGSPVAGASVHLTNPDTTPAIDVTAFSSANGIVYLPGAATSTGYRVEVTKNGYSSAYTYARDATNQNPTPGYLTVAEAQTTTGTFAIDVLADFSLATYEPEKSEVFFDTFTDASGLAESSGVSVGGGVLALALGSEGYVTNGTARSSSVAPTHLSSWVSASTTQNLPTGTSASVHVVTGSGALIPDSVLPGNAAGLLSPIALSGVSVVTYPSLALSADLATSDTMATPQILDWAIGYTRGPLPLPNIPFTLTGAKTIGSDGLGNSIVKTTTASNTGADALAELLLEWDIYTLTLSGYDVVDACTAPPYSVSPGATIAAQLVLGTATANRLLVSVYDAAGSPVAGASVTLSRSGFTRTQETSTCGAAYFGGVPQASDFSLSVSKSGYAALSLPSVSVAGLTFYAAVFE